MLSVTPLEAAEQAALANTANPPAIFRALDSAPLVSSNQMIGVNLLSGEERVYPSPTSTTSVASAVTPGSAPTVALPQERFLPSSSSVVPPEVSRDGNSPAYIFGADDRTRISQSLLTTFPWASIGRVWSKWKDGSETAGSGAMISPRVVLTAGHCVYDASRGGWANSISFSPGQDGDSLYDANWGTSFKRSVYQPYGEGYSQEMATYNGWINNGDYNYDMGYFKLDRDLGDFTGWMGWGYNNNNSYFQNQILNTAGYPGDLTPSVYDMYFTSDPITTVTTDTFRSQDDIYPGQSGSPGYFYFSSTGERTIYGVVSSQWSSGGTPSYNQYNRLTQSRYEDIVARRDQWGRATDKSDLTDYDAWFNTSYASLSSTTLQAGQSFTARSVVRNNGTAAAGSFNVTFYASTNNIISTGDYLLGTKTISSLSALSWADAIYTGVLPSNIPVGTYYVGWVIDSADSQSEYFENNNTGLLSSQLTVTSASIPAAVVSTSPADGSTISLGPTQILVNFNQPMGQGSANLYASDLTLGGAGKGTATVTSASWIDQDTAQFVIGGQWGVGQVTVQMLSGYPRSATGSALSQYTTGDFTIAAVATGSIRGRVWNDLDGDKVQDTGEAGLANWTVFLDTNKDGLVSANERTATTNTSGDYIFSNVAAGTYTVAEVLPPNWQQTYPAVAVSSAMSSESAETSGIDAVVQTRWAGRITSTGGPEIAAFPYGEEVVTTAGVGPLTQQSGPLIRMNNFRADSRFSNIRGQGLASVIIDTGIDLNHPFFGPDANGNGIADRIVYSYDFSKNDDSDASDTQDHGSNVSGIVASQDATYPGMAPATNIIHLKVFPDEANLGASSQDIEQALQWVVQNASTYKIASVNLSLGGGNYNTATTSSWSDEFAALAAMNVIVVAAAGNSFFNVGSAQGVGNVAADPNTIAVGSVYDANVGQMFYQSGAQDLSTAPDRISSFSQRSTSLLDIFAPGAVITSANKSGGTVGMTGTSQASPHIAGIATLAQQLALQRLGRRLTPTEFTQLLRSSGVSIVDGDDENDNVTNTGATFKRVDMLNLGNAIWAMGGGSTVVRSHTVTVSTGAVTGINFGNRSTAGVAEIDVRGGTLAIADNDLTPITSDGTNFGSVNVSKGVSTRSFTVTNSGTGALNLIGSPPVQILGANASDFVVITQPQTTLAPGASTVFVVAFDPRASGARVATVQIPNTDPNENPYNFSISGTGVTNTSQLLERIIDDGASTTADGSFKTAAAWTVYSDTRGFSGDVRYSAGGTGSATATWQFDSLAAGTYKIFTRWFADPNRASNAPYQVFDGGAVEGTVRLNQKVNPASETIGGISWQLIGTYTITSGTVRVVLSNAANGYVIADAVRLVQTNVAASLQALTSPLSSLAMAVAALSAEPKIGGSSASASTKPVAPNPVSSPIPVVSNSAPQIAALAITTASSRVTSEQLSLTKKRVLATDQVFASLLSLGILRA